MKKKNLDKMFNLIDDDILSEADPTKPKIKSVSKFGWMQIVAGAACLILTLNMLVFAPFLFMNNDGNDDTDPPSTGVIDLPSSDTETDSNKPSDTESSETTDTDSSVPNEPSDTDSNEPSKPNDTDSNEPSKPNDTDSNEPSKPNDTDSNVQNKPEEPGKDDDKVKFETLGGITSIKIPVPGKGTHTVTLSAPLTNAPSQYKDIIASMKDIAKGEIIFSDKNEESMEDMKDQIDDELEDSELKDEITKAEQDKYEETTNNQVQGIIEGDIIKRSSKYVYYLSGSTLKIYPLNGMETTVLTEFDLKDYINAIEKSLKIPYNPPENEELKDRIDEIIDVAYNSEMFLSTDCKTITIIVEHYINQYYYPNNDDEGIVDAWEEEYIENSRSGRYTSLISLNVEDPENVYLNDITTLFGAYESARLVNGEFLVFTKFTPRLGELVIPQYRDGESFEYIELENIHSPEKYTNHTYLVSFIIDSESYDVLSSGAYASFDGEIYVTGDNIYVTREYESEERVEEKYPIFKDGLIDGDPLNPENIVGYRQKITIIRKTATEILRIDYSGGSFIRRGTVVVDGYIKDRYSMSENREFLYVVTTVGGNSSKTEIIYEDGEKEGILKDLWDTSEKRSASIYIIDLETMEEISSVERFAPDGETVRSVEFDGYYAYVCTAVQIIDPVFFFDLTNPYEIAYSDTGTIPGFSTQLIELPSGELLGIGTDGKGNVKFEIYKKGENNTVDIVATYLVEATSYASDYKAIYINREKGLFGVGIKNWKKSNYDGYVMVQYLDGYFSLVFKTELKGTNDSKRVVYDEENDLFYLFASNDFKVFIPTIE